MGGAREKVAAAVFMVNSYEAGTATDSSWQGPLHGQKFDHGWGAFYGRFVLWCWECASAGLAGPADRQLQVLFRRRPWEQHKFLALTCLTSLLGPKRDVPSAAASHVCTHIITISDPMFIV